ncbi:MAG: hypothetical protein IIV68_05860, partial [Alistipes sp.]|nr:hypothetical protein [Alistipes sp.]
IDATKKTTLDQHPRQWPNDIVMSDEIKEIVNFARHLAVPMWVSYGYNDLVVCPTSIQGAINEMPQQPELMIVPQSRHWTYPEQDNARSIWMMNQLKK